MLASAHQISAAEWLKDCISKLHSQFQRIGCAFATNQGQNPLKESKIEKKNLATLCIGIIGKKLNLQIASFSSVSISLLLQYISYRDDPN